MRRALGYFLMANLGLGAACSPSVDDHGLTAARARWARRAPADYRFVWTRACECPPELARPIEISVASDQLTGAVYTDDRTAVADSYRSTLRTIDGMFDDLQMAIDQSADEIDLGFDAALGYPTSVFVDYSRQIADEELQLRISGLTPAAAR